MISVIVPVYKAEKYLHRCVDSILDQSYTDFEFKWNERNAHCKCPDSFSTVYPDATFQVITPKNIEEFLQL